jgi:hypothetical protein
MNEAKYCASIDLSQQPVMIGKSSAELRYLLNEGLAFFIVMMNMDFNVRHAEANDLRYSIEDFGLILLLRIKEAVLGAIAGAVSWRIFGNPGPLFTPLSHTGKGSLEGRAHAPGLEVVSDCDPRSLNFGCL